MDQQTTATKQLAFPIPRWEFIALCAALMALNALAIDIMLPGLQQIGASLGVENENHRQYVITAYFAGMAFALLAYGPASDRFGRRTPLLFGLGVYLFAAFAAALSPNFETLLALRFIQGIGAASTRVIAVSMVRDRFGGRQMAETMSLIFMVFMIIPVIAPSIGQLMMLFANWHMIFICMGLIALAITTWAAMRLPETQHPEDRRPFTLASVGQAFGIVLTTRASLWYTLASTTVFGALFGFINSAQQVYVGIYGLGVWFPVVFAGVAGLMAVSSFLNSQLVMRCRHAPAVACGAGRLLRGQRDLVRLVAVRTSAAGRLRAAVRGGDVPVRLDRLELQRARHGAARPHRRIGLIGPGLHPDAWRRAHRRLHRPVLQRHHDATCRRILRRCGA